MNILSPLKVKSFGNNMRNMYDRTHTEVERVRNTIVSRRNDFRIASQRNTNLGHNSISAEGKRFTSRNDSEVAALPKRYDTNNSFKSNVSGVALGDPMGFNEGVNI